jgi:glycosyltransferase involved in cell wall biosynthesis
MPPDVRILMDYRPALRQRTGVGRYVHEMATALGGLAPPHSTIVLFSSSWRDRLAPDAVPGTSACDWPIPVRLLNLAWHRFEWPPVERLAGPVDVAHSSHPLLMPARRAARVVTVYDLDFLDHPERTRAEIRRDYPQLAGLHARRADLVVVISEHTAQLAQSRLGVRRDRMVICRPGAPAWSPRTLPPEPGPLLFVGTIEPRKNLPTLFAAYERVVAARPEAPPLLLAGGIVEGSAPILDDLAGRPLVASRVRHLGYVSESELLRLYRDASMLLLPSLDEGFGMTALEAMHMGVPVVASARGALPEVVGDAGTLVDPLDARELAHAIERLLASPEARLRQAEAGKVRARRFSWHAAAAELLAAYQDALARREYGRP